MKKAPMPQPAIGDQDRDDLPEGWTQCTLNEVSRLVTSGSRDWSKFYSNEGAYFIRSAEINDYSLRLSEAIHVSLPPKVEGKRSLVEKGDILVTITGANVGKCAKVETNIPEAYVSQSVALIKLKQKQLASIIHYALRAPNVGGAQLSEMAYGVGRPVLSLPQLKAIKIPLPPLAEQVRMIAKIQDLLRNVNASTERLSKILKILKAFRQSVLAAAYSGRLANNLDDEPWRETTLGDVAEIKTGPFGSALHRSDYITGGVPVINPVNIIDSHIVASPDITVDRATSQRLRDYALQLGDIIIARRGEMGRCAVVTSKEQGWLCGTGSAILRLTIDAAPKFILCLITSPPVREYLTEASVGSTMDNLNQKALKATHISLPNIRTQHAIVLRIEGLLKLADQIEKRVHAATKRAGKLTQSILAGAFRGELVPTESELARKEGRAYEPASVLLERIKSERQEARAASPNGAKPRNAATGDH